MEVQVERANITDEERNKIFERVRRLAGVMLVERLKREQEYLDQQADEVDE